MTAQNNSYEISLAFAKSEGYDDVEYVIPFGNGVEAFMADYEGRSELSGIPPYILCDGSTARWADVNECYKILDQLPDEGDE